MRRNASRTSAAAESVETTTRTCTNCGAAREGRFCSVCGQNDRSYTREMGALVGELADELFQWDSRLLITLRALLLQPGLLTREFCSGRRARYVSPMRLYLIISIVFFAVLSLTSRFDGATQLDAHNTREQLEGDPEFANFFDQLTVAQRRRLSAILQEKGDATLPLRQYLAEIEKTHPPATPGMLSPIENAMRDRALDVLDDPGGATQGLIANLPGAMFLTLPVYAAWLQLFYRRRLYVEHLVFALHLHAFLFFVGTIGLLLPDLADKPTTSLQLSMHWISEAIGSALTLAALIYYFVALKRVYEDSWVRTAAKWAAVNAGHAVFVSIGVALVAAIALLLF